MSSRSRAVSLPAVVLLLRGVAPAGREGGLLPLAQLLDALLDGDRSGSVRRDVLVGGGHGGESRPRGARAASAAAHRPARRRPAAAGVDHPEGHDGVGPPAEGGSSADATRRSSSAVPDRPVPGAVLEEPEVRAPRGPGRRARGRSRDRRCRWPWPRHRGPTSVRPRNGSGASRTPGPVSTGPRVRAQGPTGAAWHRAGRDGGYGADGQRQGQHQAERQGDAGHRDLPVVRVHLVPRSGAHVETRAHFGKVPGEPGEGNLASSGDLRRASVALRDNRTG